MEPWWYFKEARRKDRESKAMAEFWPSQNDETYAHRRASYYDISTIYTILGHETTNRYKDTLLASKVHRPATYGGLAWAEHGTAKHAFKRHSVLHQQAHSSDTN